jgi:hypothetical protein
VSNGLWKVGRISPHRSGLQNPILGVRWRLRLTTPKYAGKWSLLEMECHRPVGVCSLYEMECRRPVGVCSVLEIGSLLNRGLADHGWVDGDWSDVEVCNVMETEYGGLDCARKEWK